MTYYSISALINATVSIILGLFVFYKNPRAKLNRSLFFWCLAVFSWSIFYFIWQLETDVIKALLWTRLLMLGAIWVPMAYFKVVTIFLNIESRQNKLTYFGYFLAIIFTLLLLTPLMVKNVEPAAGFLFWPKPGLAYAPFIIMFLGYTFYGLYLSICALKEYSPSKRAQIKFMIFGMVISVIGGSTNYFLWYDIPIKPYGNIFVSTYVLSTIYAIIAHRLMDIKIVLRRSSVFLASLSVVLIFAAAVKYIFDAWFYNYSSWWDDLVILVAALFLFPPLKNRFYRLANKYFFSSLYDAGEVIASLSDKLRSTLETEKIYEYIFTTLTNAFHFKAFGVLTYNKKNKLYAVRYNQGFKVGAQTGFSQDEVLDKMFIKQNKIIITEEIERAGLFEKNQTVELLLKLKVEILAPLNVKDKTIGLIALGKKESGDMYNDEDLKVLEVISAQAAIALENALLYKETKDFGFKLEKEVEKATRDLRSANAQLKKLDEAKSEFISIASHQLRTPLTVIKGYISMMLEGNFGQLTTAESESLEKVYISNERLIQLVENLLDISRIESGRLEFKFKPADLNKTVESVIEELSTNAKKKELILEFKPPAKPLPSIKMDEEKIRQVVMNLIDNAIKYTKRGKITVSLEMAKNSVKFCVADSGMGISSENMANLFKKFSRGEGTSLIHTEGTGLGLYVARLMIEAHHGRIWAESEGEGQGAEFCFEVPAGE